MANIVRKANYEEKQAALKNGHTFSIAEIEDVLELIPNSGLMDILGMMSAVFGL